LFKFQFENGLAHIPPHSLRHTNITLQLLAGVPIKAVSQRVGHASENITLNIYTHLSKDDDKKAADKFNDFMMSDGEASRQELSR
jgi:integrase